ncbi:MAG: hypothetical protein CMN58_02955 [Solibacterales bacterium]|nr:hypothetical protein [Bryobacterales bacterium]|tara:strand:+ start:20385 stop:22277 length:1893 start_codon:yes stop_codon:yes gene_type:complete
MWHGLTFLVFTLLGSSVLDAAQAINSCEPTPLYETCEIKITIDEAAIKQHPNPYMDIQLRGEFRSPKGGRTLVMPAFWDGGKQFVIRFAPLDTGQWDFRIISNVSELSGKLGSFIARPARTSGFLQVHNLRFWKFTEAETPHYWMGDTCYPFASIPWSLFTRLVDIRAEQKFNHIRGFILGNRNNAARVLANPKTPTVEHFQELDRRIAYLNQKGIIADLIFGDGDNQLAELLPSRYHRERFIRYVVARYAAFNVTWQGVERFEEYKQGRKLLEEISRHLRKWDPYSHPRSTAAVTTSGSLTDDSWMDYVVQRSSDQTLATVEYEITPAPFVNIEVGVESNGDLIPNGVDSDTLRRRLWNAAIRGQSITFANSRTWGAESSQVDVRFADSVVAHQMTHLYDFFSQTRYFDLQPYYQVNGGSAMALTFFRKHDETPRGVEFIVYVEDPGPIELQLPKHEYSVSWFNPVDGTWIDQKKKFKGELFTAAGPPDSSHDWVLYIRREGRKQSMNKSFLLAWRKIQPKKIESRVSNLPFNIQLPDKNELVVGSSFQFNATLKKTGRIARKMQWLWLAEVAGSGIGSRVLGTAQFGEFTIPENLANHYPATLGVRLIGIDGMGRSYEAFKPFRLVKK